jgi:hypothetical protein
MSEAELFRFIAQLSGTTRPPAVCRGDDETVTFQPSPVPVRSLGSRLRGWDWAWSVPFRVKA